MRELFGGITEAGISPGTIVTLSGYPGDAKSFAAKPGIARIDETDLVRLLAAGGAGRAPETARLFNDPGEVLSPVRQRAGTSPGNQRS